MKIKSDHFYSKNNIPIRFVTQIAIYCEEFLVEKLFSFWDTNLQYVMDKGCYYTFLKMLLLNSSQADYFLNEVKAVCQILILWLLKFSVKLLKYLPILSWKSWFKICSSSFLNSLRVSNFIETRPQFINLMSDVSWFNSMTNFEIVLIDSLLSNISKLCELLLYLRI